jgi:hypothetical protein
MKEQGKCIQFDWIVAFLVWQGTGLADLNATEMENPQRVSAKGGGGEDLE